MASTVAETLFVGPVTWDLVDGERRPGGAVTFAARVATALGHRARFLVAAGPDADLAAFAGHDVAIAPGTRTAVFEHTFQDGRRTLHLRGDTGVPLSPAQLPEAWRPLHTLVLAPLVPGDIDLEAWVAAKPRSLHVLMQGFLRTQDDSDRVGTDPSRFSTCALALPRASTVFVSDEDIAAVDGGAVDAVAERVARLVITRGRNGASVIAGGRRRTVPALPARPVDTTGAGDVFAAASILALDEGEEAAWRLAAACAAVSTEFPGSGPLPRRELIERRMHGR